MYGDVKGAVFGAIPASNDATHIYLGLVVLLIATVILRRSMSDWAALVPVLAVSLVMEAIDVFIVGQGFSGAARDFLHFCIAPFVLVFFLRQGWARS